MGRLPGLTGNGGTAQPWEESGSLPSGGSEHECWTGLFQRRACGKSPTQARQELSRLRHLKSPVWLEPSRAGGDRGAGTEADRLDAGFLTFTSEQ